jgi:parvulin-like peptidyl-prolyl isomerase
LVWDWSHREAGSTDSRQYGFNILSAKEANSTGLINDPDVKAQVDKILAAAYLQSVPKDKIPIEEADIKAYYDANLDKYKSQELIKASHILVKSLDEANKISGELIRRKFSELAAKRSIDSLRKQDGLVGLLLPNAAA